MSMKLLVVDDERPVLNVLRTLLEELGAEVVGFTAPQEAAAQLEVTKFDGIFLDVRMEGLDGIELTRRVRASTRNKTVPVIILTGMDDVKTMREGFRAGATCFMGKPVTRERIQNLMSSIRGSILAEKRRHIRLPLRTRVVCKWGEKERKQLYGASINIGESGMLIEPAGGLEVGQSVDLEFVVPPKDKPLSLRGKVLRKEPPDRLALEFVGTTFQDTEPIREYISGKNIE